MENLFINVPLICIFIGGVLVAIFGLMSANYEEKIPRWVSIGTFIGGIVVVAGGFLSDYEQNRFQSEIIRLNQENSKLNKHISNSVTGGDSYCYVEITITKPPENRVWLNLRRKGQYPIYDIDINIDDMTKMATLPFELAEHPNFPNISKEEYSEYAKKHDTWAEFQKIRQLAEIHKQFPVMTPRSSVEVGRYQLSEDATEQKYFVRIFTRNGIVEQLINFQLFSDQWKRSFRTYLTDNSGKMRVGDEHVDPNVPIEKGYGPL